MRTGPFDTVTRHAGAAVSRRTSLLTLGVAPFAAAATRPDISSAKKKSGIDCKKKEKQRCTNDAAACRATVTAVFCPGRADYCAKVLPSCDECTADGFLAGLIAAIE